MSITEFNAVTTQVRMIRMRERKTITIEPHLLRMMMMEFRTAAAARPFAKHDVLALNCFVRATQIPVKEMLERDRTYPLVEIRQQGIVFVYIAVPELPIAGLCRLFERRRFTVHHALKKYEAEMRRLFQPEAA